MLNMAIVAEPIACFTHIERAELVYSDGSRTLILLTAQWDGVQAYARVRWNGSIKSNLNIKRVALPHSGVSPLTTQA